MLARVVVATQVGMPSRYARTKPAVTAVVVAMFPAALPYKTVPAWMVAQPVPPLATPRMPPRVRVPDEVMGPPVRVRPVVPPEPSTEVTVPVPPPRQVPAIAQQPEVRFTPLANEEVAAELEYRAFAIVVEELVMEKRGLEVAYASLEDAMMNEPSCEVRTKCFWSVPPCVSERVNDGALPATCSFQNGVVVPMPRLPAKYAVPLSKIVNNGLSDEFVVWKFT